MTGCKPLTEDEVQNSQRGGGGCGMCSLGGRRKRRKTKRKRKKRRRRKTKKRTKRRTKRRR